MREIDFRTIDKKELFKLMLKHDSLDFGFIPKWRRKSFLSFCKKHKLIVPFSPIAPKENFRVMHNFSYTATRADLGGLLFAGLFEWLADLTVHRNWKICPDFYFTNLNTYNIRSGRRVDPRFDYVRAWDDIIYER